MGEDTSRPLKQYPITIFYVLAFAFTWLGWIPQALYARGLFPFDHPLLSLLGGAGPTLAAVIMILLVKGRDGPRELFAPLFKWRVPWLWFLFVFSFWFIVAAIALGIGAILGQPLPPLSRFVWASLLPIFITMLVSNVWEEIGWRGFALPYLQKRYSDLEITFIMGLLWSLWHLPLLLNPASPMSNLPWLGEVLFSLALTVIYIWLYNHTRRSLLLVSIFHAMSNTIAFVLLELGVFTSSYLFIVSIVTIFASLIILRYGRQRFARSNLCIQ